MRVYLGDLVYQNVKIARFLCRRRNPDVPAGTHRTFSLLPCFLIPYSPYALDVTLSMAETVAEQNENAYRASHILASAYENLHPEPITLRRIEHRLHETICKLKHLPAISEQVSVVLSAFITLANTYRSCLISGASGAAALCYDWFYFYQKDLPYMQRDFLFGSPSQRRFCRQFDEQRTGDVHPVLPKQAVFKAYPSI